MIANLEEVFFQVIMGGLLGIVCAKFMESPEVLAKIRKFQQAISNGDRADPVKEHRPMIEVASYTCKISTAEHNCIICYDALCAEEQVTDCGHCCRTFHAKCLKTWVNTGSAKCPLCRRSWSGTEAPAKVQGLPQAISLSH